MTTIRTTWRSHAGALLLLGLPIVGSHLAGFFIHVTDTVMLGWYGVEELAAVVLGGTFWFVLFILGSGFGSALPPIVAGAAARGDDRQIRRATRMGIWLTLGYGLAVSPIFLFAEQILLAMGQVPEVAKLAGDYLLIAGWSVIPGLMTNLYRSYLSALQRPGLVLWVTVGGFFVHAGINWLLIFGNAGFPAMGIRGAAVSTLLTDASILAILVVASRRMFPGHELWARFWRVDREMLARIFGLGWPIGLQLLAEVGLFSGAAVMMGWVSAEMLAAHGIALQLASTTFLVHLGLANAATIRAGQAVGIADRVALRDGALTAVIMSVVFATVTMAIFLAIPEQLMGLFLDPSDPDTPGVIAAGVVLVTMAAVFQTADGGQAMAIGLLRGVQDTRVPMIIAVVCYWFVGLPLSYGLGFVAGWGGVGVWTGLVAGLATVWLALSVRFWGGAIRGAVPG
jgi:MATE family multidrug resistance protein